MSKPAFGHTRLGLPVHARAHDHLPSGTPLADFNKWLAVKVTSGVGTMWCAYVFLALSLVSLPAALASGSVIVIVSWIAQTCLQLVLLSVILVGQQIMSLASDSRQVKTLEDVESVKQDLGTALDRLDTTTTGGLTEVLAAVRAGRDEVGRLSEMVRASRPGEPGGG